MTGLLLFLSPLPLALIYAWIKKTLRERRVAADPVTPAIADKPYQPKPEPNPGIFLRRFNAGERAYLREQRATALIGFCVVAWFFFTMLGSSLLPSTVSGYDVTSRIVLPVTQPLARRVWFSFVFNSGLLVYAAAMIGVITAMTNGLGLLTTVTATLTRTRPITHRLRFWGRTLPAFFALAGGYVTGIGLVFVVMLAVYGPVWRHLELTPAHTAAVQNVSLGRAHALPVDDEDSPHYDDPDVREARHIRWYRQSSPPRALLSIFTTMLLTWSAFLFVFSRPFSGIFKKVQMTYWKFLIAPVVFLITEQLMFSHIKTALFMYGSSTPPQVPAWHFVLVPVLLTAAFLGLGEFFFARAEF